MKKRFYFVLGLALAALILTFIHSPMPVKALAAGCASGSPASGTYTVTACLTVPAGGSVLSGAQTVTGTVSVSGSNPGVQRMVFGLNGAYLLTDYSSPYTFSLSTTKWVDGAYQLSVYPIMRDGFSISPASISVTFNNGITTPPVNTNQFQPSTGNPPASGQPFLVAATGDGASGQSTSAQVVNLVQSLNPNLFIYLGDVYEEGSSMEFSNWYGVNSNFGSLRAITDPTVGNHEYLSSSTAQGYFDYWNNIPNYYSFNAGGWHFISLNSNSTSIGVSSSSAQYKWLQQDLAGNPLPCTLVFYHEPLFNIGPEGPRTSMSSIWSLLAQYNVPIVLNGHDHDYQRWMPLDGNGNPSPTGVTEFIAGGGGHSLQTFTKTDSRVAYSNDTNPTAFGALLLQLNSTSANFSYHSINGTILDSGTISCANAGSNPTPTPTPAATNTPSATPTPTLTPRFTDTPTFTFTPAATGTPTPTQAATNTPANTNTPTATLTATNTPAPTNTPVSTPTNTPAATNTPTATNTPVNTPTPTFTPAATNTPTATSSGGSVTFTPVADAYVDSSNPTVNNGTSTLLRIDGSPTVNTYIKFTVSGLTGTVTKVTLRIFANSSGSLGIKANSVADTTWGETTITYNNAPPMGSVLATSAAFTSGTWVTLDLTGYITTNGTYSVGIIDPSATAISLASRESGANAEQLIIVTQ